MYMLTKPLFKIGERLEAMATTKLKNNTIFCHDSVTDTNQSKLYLQFPLQHRITDNSQTHKQLDN